MTLTLADNPALTPELAEIALSKCLEFFKGLSFSDFKEGYDKGDIQENIKLHEALIDGRGSLDYEISNIPIFDENISLRFTVIIDGISTYFHPFLSELGEKTYIELSKILTDDEIGSLFLLGAKKNLVSGEDKLLSHIASGTLDEPIHEDGLITHFGLNTSVLETAKFGFQEIQGSTSAQVRHLLEISE